MKEDKIIIEFSATAVRIFKREYIPVQRKNGRKVNGTGVTKQIKFANFKRKELEIPENVMEILTKKQAAILQDELKSAYEADIAPAVNIKFHEEIESLGAYLDMLHLIEILPEDIKSVATILAKLKKVSKIQAKPE